MEIHQLKTFISVAQEGSITRASDRLFLSQPAVSAHIKAIEDTLGVVLFVRTVRGMLLTEQGRTLLAQAENVLAEHQRLLVLASQLKAEPSGYLRLGVNGASAAVLAALVAVLSARYPGIELKLHYAGSKEILEQIRDGRLDAGFYNETATPSSDISVLEVARFSIYLAASKGLLDVGGEPNWPLLASYPWVCPTTSTCCGALVEQLFEAHNIQPQMVAIDNEQAIQNLIVAGAGIGLLHENAALEAVERDEIELIYKLATPARTLFAYSSKSPSVPLIRLIHELLVDVIGG